MAYVDQEKKAKIAPVVKAICKRYGVKASLSVKHHMTLTLTIQSSGIDFIGNFNKVAGSVPRHYNDQFRPAKDHIEVNTYWQHNHFSGVAKEFLEEVKQALLGPDYFDHSDIMADYYHCSHYISIHIGRWDKPYKYAPADSLIAA
jgi:hypothetical protein